MASRREKTTTQAEEEETQRLLPERERGGSRIATTSTTIPIHTHHRLREGHRRSASVGAIKGGTDHLGSFQILNDALAYEMNHNHHNNGVTTFPKSYSYSTDMDGRPSRSTSSYNHQDHTLTPSQMGRQELYRDIPFTAVFGLQRMEHAVSSAFAQYAANLDIQHTTASLNDEEKKNRMSRASSILLDELEFEASVVTTSLVLAIVIAALSQFLVGYNTGVMNAPAAVVFPGHSTLSWSGAVSAFAIGGPFGALLAGRMADARGRRGALMACTWTFLLGGLLQTLAWNMLSIIGARLIIGFGSGLSSVLVPIYLGEIAPPTVRGMLGTVTQFAIVVGILVSALLALPLANEAQWRGLFAVTPILALTQLALAPFLLESPRWLLAHNPHSVKARFILKRLRGLRHDHEVEAEVGYYLMGGAAQQCSSSNSSSRSDSSSDPPPSRSSSSSFIEILKEIWSQRKVRLLLISSIVLQMGQQFSGINAVFYYSTSFFEGVIDNPLHGTILVETVNVIATYVVLFLMDRCGRKTLILWSAGGMFFSCCLIVASLLGYFSNIMALVAVNAYVIFFEFGLGPIPWLIVAEMFSAKYVATAMSLNCQVNWVCNWIVGFVFPFLAQRLGPYSFMPFAMVLAGIFVFAFYILPETRGTTPEALAAQRTRSLLESTAIVYQPNVEAANKIDIEWRNAMAQLQQEEFEESER